MKTNDITDGILGAAVRVHQHLGPGLLESTYQTCLAAAMEDRGLQFSREHELPVLWEGRRLDARYRLDFLVEDRVVVEVKAVREMHPVFTAQTLTYMRVGGFPVGLLINFTVPYMGDGAIKRLVNRYDGPSPRNQR